MLHQQMNLTDYNEHFQVFWSHLENQPPDSLNISDKMAEEN